MIHTKIVTRGCATVLSLFLCSPSHSMTWTGEFVTSGITRYAEWAVISGRVTLGECEWMPKFDNGPPRVYVSPGGGMSSNLDVPELRGLAPQNCSDAVDMVNNSGIWDKRLYFHTLSAATWGGPFVVIWVKKNPNCNSSRCDGARFIWYQEPGPAVPTPASCTAFQPPSIDFGTIDPKEISGRKATSRIVVSCDKKASVRVRFMTREGLAIYQMDNGLTTYLKIDDNPGTNGSYQTVAENASSPARAFNLSAELLGTSGSVKPGAFSYTAVVRVDIL